MEPHRQRLPSVVAADLLPSLEGVELGSSGKVNIHPQPPRIGKYSPHFTVPASSPSPDGLLRSVPLPHQRLGEGEELGPS